MSDPALHITQFKEDLSALGMPTLFALHGFVARAEMAISEEGLRRLRELSGPQGFAVLTGERSYLRIHAFDRNGLIIASGHSQLIREVSGAHEGQGGRCVRDARGVYLLAQNYRENQLCYDRSERDILPSSPFARILVCAERSSSQGSTHTEVDLATGAFRLCSRNVPRRVGRVSALHLDHLTRMASNRGVEWFDRVWTPCVLGVV